MDKSDLMRRLADLLREGRPAALVTVVAVEGSAPREPGAKMLVLEDGRIEGTIGGGRLEAAATEAAVEALAQGAPRRLSFALEPKELGMYCSGRVELFVDVFRDSLKLVILGGGHVGEKVAALAAFLGIPHRVADDRAEFADPARFPRARQVLTAPPDGALKLFQTDADTAVAIVTRCHGFDLRCLAAALGTPAFYIGMIGSAAKTRRLFDLCERRGLSPADDSRVHAPVGLDLGGRSPEEIALSILAEVLKVKNGASGASLRLSAAALHA